MPELAHGHDLGLPKCKLTGEQLFDEFIQSRRQGISSDTMKYYRQCLIPFLTHYKLTSEGINSFLCNLKCNAGGNLSYSRVIRAFCNWLIRNDYLKDSPLKKVDSPKPAKPILPSLTREQVSYLIEQVDNIRDKAIIITNRLEKIKARD